MTAGPTLRPALAAILLVLLAAFLSGAALAADRPVWMAVGPNALVEAVEPLAAHRRAEGFEVVTASGPVEKAIESCARRPDFVLLLGDDEPGRADEPWHLAAGRRRLYRWREVQRREFASDAIYGDFDADLVPDVPVGRIPARNAEEAALVAGKIVAFERRKPGPQDLRLNVWTGSPNYGPLVDSMATGMMLAVMDTAAPKWVEPWFISGDPRHPLCGWPPDQPGLFTQRMREGGLLNVMVGHSSAERFFSVKHGDEPIWYTAADARAALAEGPPAAPLLIYSCDAGRFDGQSPCLAESFLFFPAGPVAVVGATTESHPLTNYFSGQGMLEAVGAAIETQPGAEPDAGPPRLGSLWLAAQRRARTARNVLVEGLLRDVEGKLEPTIDVEKLRRDQVLMYALLGDPATRLRLPRKLTASIERAQDGWRWRAVRPEGANTLSLDFRPAKVEIPPRGDGADPQAARAAFLAANAQYAYEPLPAPTGDTPWTGTLARPGRLRLVATGPDALYVTVLHAE